MRPGAGISSPDAVTGAAEVEYSICLTAAAKTAKSLV